MFMYFLLSICGVVLVVQGGDNRDRSPGAGGDNRDRSPGAGSSVAAIFGDTSRNNSPRPTPTPPPNNSNYETPRTITSASEQDEEPSQEHITEVDERRPQRQARSAPNTSRVRRVFPQSNNAEDEDASAAPRSPALQSPFGTSVDSVRNVTPGSSVANSVDLQVEQNNFDGPQQSCNGGHLQGERPNLEVVLGENVFPLDDEDEEEERTRGSCLHEALRAGLTDEPSGPIEQLQQEFYSTPANNPQYYTDADEAARFLNSLQHPSAADSSRVLDEIRKDRERRESGNRMLPSPTATIPTLLDEVNNSTVQQPRQTITSNNHVVVSPPVNNGNDTRFRRQISLEQLLRAHPIRDEIDNGEQEEAFCGNAARDENKEGDDKEQQEVRSNNAVQQQEVTTGNFSQSVEDDRGASYDASQQQMTSNIPQMNNQEEQDNSAISTTAVLGAQNHANGDSNDENNSRRGSNTMFMMSPFVTPPAAANLQQEDDWPVLGSRPPSRQTTGGSMRVHVPRQQDEDDFPVLDRSRPPSRQTTGGSMRVHVGDDNNNAAFSRSVFRARHQQMNNERTNDHTISNQEDHINGGSTSRATWDHVPVDPDDPARVRMGMGGNSAHNPLSRHPCQVSSEEDSTTNFYGTGPPNAIRAAATAARSFRRSLSSTNNCPPLPAPEQTYPNVPADPNHEPIGFGPPPSTSGHQGGGSSAAAAQHGGDQHSSSRGAPVCISSIVSSPSAAVVRGQLPSASSSSRLQASHFATAPSHFGGTSGPVGGASSMMSGDDDYNCFNREQSSSPQRNYTNRNIQEVNHAQDNSDNISCPSRACSTPPANWDSDEDPVDKDFVREKRIEWKKKAEKIGKRWATAMAKRNTLPRSNWTAEEQKAVSAATDAHDKYLTFLVGPGPTDRNETLRQERLERNYLDAKIKLRDLRLAIEAERSITRYAKRWLECASEKAVEAREEIFFTEANLLPLAQGAAADAADAQMEKEEIILTNNMLLSSDANRVQHAIIFRNPGRRTNDPDTNDILPIPTSFLQAERALGRPSAVESYTTLYGHTMGRVFAQELRKNRYKIVGHSRGGREYVLISSDSSLERHQEERIVLVLKQKRIAELEFCVKIFRSFLWQTFNDEILDGVKMGLIENDVKGLQLFNIALRAFKTAVCDNMINVSGWHALFTGKTSANKNVRELNCVDWPTWTLQMFPCESHRLAVAYTLVDLGIALELAPLIVCSHQYLHATLHRLAISPTRRFAEASVQTDPVEEKRNVPSNNSGSSNGRTNMVDASSTTTGENNFLQQGRAGSFDPAHPRTIPTGSDELLHHLLRGPPEQLVHLLVAAQEYIVNQRHDDNNYLFGGQNARGNSDNYNRESAPSTAMGSELQSSTHNTLPSMHPSEASLAHLQTSTFGTLPSMPGSAPTSVDVLPALLGEGSEHVSDPALNIRAHLRNRERQTSHGGIFISQMPHGAAVQSLDALPPIHEILDREGSHVSSNAIAEHGTSARRVHSTDDTNPPVQGRTGTLELDTKIATSTCDQTSKKQGLDKNEDQFFRQSTYSESPVCAATSSNAPDSPVGVASAFGSDRRSGHQEVDEGNINDVLGRRSFGSDEGNNTSDSSKSVQLPPINSHFSSERSS